MHSVSASDKYGLSPSLAFQGGDNLQLLLCSNMIKVNSLRLQVTELLGKTLKTELFNESHTQLQGTYS